ncbi:MAG: hypothetical protein F6K41_13770 [Symploca sp. SIO3E6]|nr:hypothetical protein [Caldora sp. SIO3E6]
MTRDNNQLQNSLCEALVHAYKDKKELERTLKTQLNWDLNDIDTTQSYRGIVQDLIERRERRGELRQLVIGASKGNPGNPSLRKFVQDFLPNLLIDIDDKLTPGLVILLTNYLRHFLEFHIVNYCCRLVIPDSLNYSDQRFIALDDNRLAPDVKWLIVLNLLLKEYPDGITYIIKFVICLKREVNQRTLQQNLDHWLEQIFQLGLYPIFCQEILAIRGYLSIFVKPSSVYIEPAFLVNWFISIETTQQDGLIQTRLISPQEVDLSAANRSQLGVYYNLQEIEESLFNWEHQAETMLENEAEQLGCSYEGLTIEFILPYKYFSEPVERWQVRDILQWQEESISVGQKHRVVVRSLDRLQKYSLFSVLHDKWQNNKQFLQNNPPAQEIQARIEQLNCLASCNLDELTQRLESSEKIALKITCVMPKCTAVESSTEALDQKFGGLFEALVKGSIPIALWFRQSSSGGNVESTMDQLLTLDRLTNLNELLTGVRTLRNNAAGNHQDPGHHLAILCDEPERLQQLKPLFRGSPLREVST